MCTSKLSFLFLVITNDFNFDWKNKNTFICLLWMDTWKSNCWLIFLIFEIDFWKLDTEERRGWTVSTTSRVLITSRYLYIEMEIFQRFIPRFTLELDMFEKIVKPKLEIIHNLFQKDYNIKVVVCFISFVITCFLAERYMYQILHPIVISYNRCLLLNWWSRNR